MVKFVKENSKSPIYRESIFIIILTKDTWKPSHSVQLLFFQGYHLTRIYCNRRGENDVLTLSTNISLFIVHPIIYIVDDKVVWKKKFNLPFDLIHVGESPKTKSAVRTVVCPSRMEGVKNPFRLISSEILWWNYDFIGRTIFVTVKHQVTVLKICAPSTRRFFFLHYNLAENKFLSHTNIWSV